MPELIKPGAAATVLAANVALLDPAERVFEAMLEGWKREQISRGLKAPTTSSERQRLIKRLQEFTSDYPWDWNRQDNSDFCASLISSGGIVISTARYYQGHIRIFMEYASDPRNGWVSECEKRFGRAPQQICDDWNTTDHDDEFEGLPERRPLTYDEIQTLFDFCDDRYGTIKKARKKGALAAARDAVYLKTVYAYGLRRNAGCKLATFDFHRNPKVKEYGRFGMLHVRFGKAKRGGAPRRYPVLTVPELDWIVDVMEQYITDIRPLFHPGNHPALFITERMGYFHRDKASELFHDSIIGAGLDQNLELHCLRHSYSTHLAEFRIRASLHKRADGPWLGLLNHIYTHTSNDFKNSAIEAALSRLYDKGTR